PRRRSGGSGPGCTRAQDATARIDALALMYRRVVPLEPSARAGMGALPYAGGTTFRVWAPHATAAAVVGSFNEWDPTRHPSLRDDDGHAETWSTDVASAGDRDEYRVVLRTPAGERNRIHPRARRLTHSAGTGGAYDADAFRRGRPAI